MADRSAVCAGIVRSSCGTHLLDHLAAHGTGLLAGQVAVVALLQVDTHLVGRFHLELIQSLAGIGDQRLLVGRHNSFLLYLFILIFFVSLDGTSEHSIALEKRTMQEKAFLFLLIFHHFQIRETVGRKPAQRTGAGRTAGLIRGGGDGAAGRPRGRRAGHGRQIPSPGSSERPRP